MENRNYGELVRRLERVVPGGLTHLGEVEHGGKCYPLLLVELGHERPARRQVMIAAGIHGNEPAGVEAAVRFIEGLQGGHWRYDDFAFDVFPCNNPTGWELGTRENVDGIDLNRTFATVDAPTEVALITSAVADRRYDLVVELHEDTDAPGFYLYELAVRKSDRVGESIVEAVASVGVPVNHIHEVEGLTAIGGIVRHSIRKYRRTRLPQAVYCYRNCANHVITLEPPASVLNFADRVRVELLALETALKAIRSRRSI